MDALVHSPESRRLRPRRPVGAPAHRFGKPRQRPVDRPDAGHRSLSAQDHHLRRRARPRQRRPLVEVAAIGRDDSAFPLEYQPGNEAADENGYVKMPNVNVLIEMADMREANRSYEANLQVIKQARDLISMTIDLMRSQ